VPIPRLVALLALVGLAVPWARLLISSWSDPTRSPGASVISFAAALLLALRALRDIGRTPGSRPWLGVAALAVTTAGYALSTATDFRVGAGLLMVGILTSLIYLDRGRTGVRALGLPLGLLALSTPIPGFVSSRLSAWLVDTAAILLPWLLQPLIGGVAAEGHVLHFEGGSVAIVDDCSGLDGILLFVPIAILVVWAHRPIGPLAGGLVLLSAIPLAFAGNLLRVVVSALLVAADSPLAYSDPAHEILGVVTLALSLAALVMACRAGRSRPRPARAAEQVA
jgi:exosortase